MSWETLADDSYSCPKCGNEVRIRFRMDDWNRREFIMSENGTHTTESFTNPSPPTCRNCGIKMDFLKSNPIE